MTTQNFVEIDNSFQVDPDYQLGLREVGITSIDSVFSFSQGTDLHKENLAPYRSRIEFKITSPERTLFLKRYDRAPILVQLKSWLNHRRRASLSSFEFEPAGRLNAARINAPKTICRGQQWGGLFEKRSFIITEKIADAQSLEKKLPACFDEPSNTKNRKLRNEFIDKLANFVKKFHATNYRHRDLYLCHIFHDASDKFYLIDLARAFKPRLFAERFRVKDIAQLYYSTPGSKFSRTDRLRFYQQLTGRDKLTKKDKRFIGKVKNKAKRMAKHDSKHERNAPFAC